MPDPPQFDGVVAETTPAAEPTPPETNARDLAEIDLREYFENYGNQFQSAAPVETEPDDDERRPTVDNIVTRSPELLDYLLWQLRLSSLDPEEERIGEIVIGNLDRDGRSEVMSCQRGLGNSQDIEQLEHTLCVCGHSHIAGVGGVAAPVTKEVEHDDAMPRREQLSHLTPEM